VLSAESIRSIDRVYADLLPIDVQQYAPELLREEIGFGVAWWQVLGLLLCLFLGWLSRSLVAKWAIWIGVKFLRRRGDGTSEELLAKAAQPVGTLVMAIVVWRLIPLLLFPLGFNNVANIALQVLVALSGVMLVYRLVDVVSEILQRRADQTDTKLDDQLIPLLRKSAKVIVVVIGGIFVLQNLDVDVESLLAGVGVGGLAFSFAARDMIANLFGSVSIFADGPFQIGDWVAVGGDEGSVEEVGMRATRIRTANNTVLTIPNSKIADAVVENWSLRPKRRTRVILGVGYDSTPEQVEAFCRGIGGILDANARVEPESHVAMMSGFGDSALEITVFFHLKVESLTGEMQEKHNIFLEFMRLAAALGVEFAYPTQTLHVASTVSPLAAPSMTSRTPEALAAIADSFGPGGAESHPDGPTLPAAAGASSAESSE
jgi:MscS family membrane protein